MDLTVTAGRDDAEHVDGGEYGYLLTRVFGDPEIANILSMESTIESWLAVERALAWAQVGAGLLEASDASAIEEGATLECVGRAQRWSKHEWWAIPYSLSFA